MEEITFNQWMAHIYRELGHPEEKIKKYEQGCESEEIIHRNRPVASGVRHYARYEESQDTAHSSINQ
jgi:hypothetical protein